MCHYWWSKSTTRRGIHWCSWEGLCDLKEVGGLGFCDLLKVNIALPTKQGWCLTTSPSSLMARVLKAKYYPTSNFMEIELGHQPSFVWQSIWAAKGLL